MRLVSVSLFLALCVSKKLRNFLCFFVEEKEKRRKRANIFTTKQKMSARRGTISFLSRWLKPGKKRQLRVVILGLDQSGKTKLLNKMKGCDTDGGPTVSYNCDNIKFKGHDFVFYDLAGDKKVRNLWRHYYQNVQVVMFIVDGSESTRMEEAAEEFRKVLREEELKEAFVVVLVNKCDIEEHMKKEDVISRLELKNVANKRKWLVQEVSGITGDGLSEALEWIINAQEETEKEKEQQT